MAKVCRRYVKPRKPPPAATICYCYHDIFHLSPTIHQLNRDIFWQLDNICCLELIPSHSLWWFLLAVCLSFFYNSSNTFYPIRLSFQICSRSFSLLHLVVCCSATKTPPTSNTHTTFSPNELLESPSYNHINSNICTFYESLIH